MKTILAFLVLLCGMFVPFAVLGDEAKTPNAATTGSTAPTAMLDKSIGRWNGACGNHRINWSLDFGVQKKGEEFIGEFISSAIGRRESALKVKDGKIMGDFSDQNVTRIFTITTVNDTAMEGILFLEGKTASSTSGTRLCGLTRKT